MLLCSLTVPLYSTLQPFQANLFLLTQDEFQLHLGEYTGNAGNSLVNTHMAPPEEETWIFPGIKFSTYDHLNDSESRCIRHSKSGWWFSRSGCIYTPGKDVSSTFTVHLQT